MKVTEKEEYVQRDDTDEISEERRKELISKVREIVGSGDSIADFQLNNIIGDVEEDQYNREYQFLMDYLKSEGILLRGTSLLMSSINELNSNLTERTGGPGQLDYRTKRQKRMLEVKKKAKSAKLARTRELNSEIKELKVIIQGLDKSSQEYKAIRNLLIKRQEELQTLEREIKVLNKEIASLSWNVPMYDEKLSKELFKKFFAIKERITQLNKELSECGEDESEHIRISIELKRAEREYVTIKNKIAENSMRLVYFALYCKRDYQHRLVMNLPEEYTEDDKLQEGYIALLQTIDTYDPTKGAFSTYAVYNIRFKINRFAATSKDGGYPRGAKEINHSIFGKIRNLKSVRDKLQRELGREPTTKEIADYMWKTEEFVEELLVLEYRFDHMEDLYEEETGEPTQQVDDVLIDETSLETEVFFHSLQEEIGKALNTLEPRHRLILIKVLGLDGRGPKTYAEIAKELGIPANKVREICMCSLSEIRNYCRENKSLIDFIDDPLIENIENGFERVDGTNMQERTVNPVNQQDRPIQLSDDLKRILKLFAKGFREIDESLANFNEILSQDFPDDDER